MWDVILSHPAVTLAMMGVLATTVLWLGLIVATRERQATQRQIDEIERLKRDAERLLKDVRR